MKSQIKDRDSAVVISETPEIEIAADDEITIKVGGGPYIKNGYFYVSKWGVKYKLSDDLTEYGFSVMENSEDHAFGEYLIGMSAVRKSDKTTNPQARYFDDITSCSMITVSRITKEKWDSIQPYGGPAAVVEEDDYVYILYDYNKYFCDLSEDRTNAASEIILNDILSNPESI